MKIRYRHMKSHDRDIKPHDRNIKSHDHDMKSHDRDMKFHADFCPNRGVAVNEFLAVSDRVTQESADLCHIQCTT